MRLCIISISLFGLACSSSKNDSGTVDTGATANADAIAQNGDEDRGDTGADTGEGPSVADDPCTPERLRALALSDGRVIMEGIVMDASTALTDLVADPNGFEGQILQIEGTVTDLCDSRGCWALLDDGEGNAVRLKVNDGAVDMRDETDFGEYGIGEGAFEAEGEYGPQIWITGAVATPVPDECQ
jgi:hypothetical protein